MKKLYVYRLNEKVVKVEALSVTSDAEILYSGVIGSTVPNDVQVLLDQADAQKSKEDQVKAAYDVMVKDVYAEMLSVFGTDNDVSAQATASTYEAMAKRPVNYVGNLGLVDEAAVTAYANAKIAEADAYAVFRLSRIAQFQSEKEAIINS